MNTSKRLMAAAFAMIMCMSMAGCANEIEYKSPDSFTSSSQVQTPDKPEDSSSDIDEPDTSDTPDTPDTPDKPSSELVVKEKDTEYFSKCAFVGEALCSGMSYISDISDEHLYTNNNAHVHDIGETTWTINGQSYKLPEALFSADRKYIYIWVGPNDLTSYNPDSFASKYEELIDKITYANPMAYVGVISVAPVSKGYEQGLGGDTVAQYNLKLAEMVDQIKNNRVRFFNLVAVLGDNDGYLKGEYDSGDGLHMTASAYKAVASFLFDNQIHPYLADFEVQIGDVTTDEQPTDDNDNTENTTEE